MGRGRVAGWGPLEAKLESLGEHPSRMFGHLGRLATGVAAVPWRLGPRRGFAGAAMILPDERCTRTPLDMRLREQEGGILGTNV